MLVPRQKGHEAALEAHLGGKRAASVEALGSALKFCRLAEGAADLYVRPGRTMEWGHGRAASGAGGGRRLATDHGRWRPCLWQAGLGQSRLRLPRRALTEILHPDAGGLARAAGLLRDGALVAFGTETVYGLGADATNGRAVAAIFEAKGRPHFNPLICHFPDADAAFAQVVAGPLARRLAEAFWPGPLTLVLPRRADCPVDLLAGAGLDTLAVRVPAHPDALSLLRACGFPVAAPSANRSGGVSPSSAAHVLADLGGRIEAVLDCGPCVVGLESTVLDLSGTRPFLLRPGGIPAEAIEAVAGPIRSGISLAQAEASRNLRSPGLLVSHYAPCLPVRLGATSVGAREALLAFGPALATQNPVWNLSEAGDLAEAASRLFAGLRHLDAQAAGLDGIAAMRVPEAELGAAINDRLARAAAPRPTPALGTGAVRRGSSTGFEHGRTAIKGTRA